MARRVPALGVCCFTIGTLTFEMAPAAALAEAGDSIANAPVVVFGQQEFGKGPVVHRPGEPDRARASDFT